MAKQHEDKTRSSQKKQSGPLKEEPSRMKRLFGFEWENLSSFDNFIKLMTSPRDPSQLGIYRFLFGEL